MPELYLQYEEAVKEVKAEGLKQCVKEGLDVNQKFALFSPFTGRDDSLRRFQQTSAVEALRTTWYAGSMSC